MPGGIGIQKATRRKIEDRREDRLLGDAEEDEGADHAGVDRADPRRRQREEVGDHAEEEALDDDRERHVDAEGVEGGPEHADARRPEAGGAEHRQAAARGVGEEAEREAEALAQRRRHFGDAASERAGRARRGRTGEPPLEVGRDQGDQHADDEQQAGDRRRG